MKRLITFAALVAAALLVAIQDFAESQDWPTRPVTMVVPFAPGGPLDVLGRILQPYLGEALGQQVIVENVPGGGGSTGSLRVSNAAADSHMFVLGSIGTHSINQSMHKKPLYDAATDFAPVILVADAPLVLLARKHLPANDFHEFVAHIKASHATMQFGSGGAGTSSHIGCVLLNQTIGVHVTHVPYRGGGMAMQDLIAGRIDYICNYISTAIPAVMANTAKVLAALSSKRTPSFPDLPTADELGLKDFDITAWNAIFMPKSTPTSLVRRLNAAVSGALDNPALRKRLEAIGLDVPPPERRSPAYLGKFVVAEIAKWAAPVKASGVSND